MRARSFQYASFDVPLHEPFGIATGAQHQANNVFVRLELEDGSVGFGEAAPVPHISGESRADVLSALSSVSELLVDLDLNRFRPVCSALGELLHTTPSGLAAVEVALFDALCKSRGMPLVNFFGGSAIHLDIDVTITTGSVEQARASARKYSRAGFSRFKIKVGATDLDDDARRVRAVAEVASGAQIILDGNTAYKPIEAVALLDALGSARSTVILFEQPVPRDDLEGLAEVEAKSGIIVAADESLRSGDDFQAILKTGGISAINLKTAKLGLLTAWDLLVAARGAGLFIMVGGMVETAISMSASACLAAGVGGVSYADLDTPLFLGAHPVKSSISPWGPRLDFSAIKAGHGADWCGPFPENVAPIEQLLD